MIFFKSHFVIELTPSGKWMHFQKCTLLERVLCDNIWCNRPSGCVICTLAFQTNTPLITMAIQWPSNGIVMQAVTIERLINTCWLRLMCHYCVSTFKLFYFSAFLNIWQIILTELEEKNLSKIEIFSLIFFLCFMGVVLNVKEN